MSVVENKIQIVAFSTNDIHQTPNDVINIFLETTLPKYGL